MKQKITIIGAGLAGCFLAILFAKKGYKVTVFEQLSEQQMIIETSKRSFALAIYGYGAEALSKAGLWDALSDYFLKLEGSVTQIGNRKQVHPIITKMDKEPFYAISRAAFLKGLLEEAKKYASITFHFEKTLIALDSKAKTIQIKNKKTKKIATVSCNVVFGADGVNSIVRSFLQKEEKKNVEKIYSTWSYKQVFFPKTLAKKSGLHGNFSQNWTRKNAIFVAYPNYDESYHGMFILPQESHDNFSSLTTKEKIEKFVFTYFPDFMPALSKITDAFLTNPEGYFVTIDSPVWYHEDFVALVGDAAHGFPPFYGQGISAAIADSMEIINLIELYGDQWGDIFPLYQKVRKSNTDALALLSNQTLQQYRREKIADYSAIYTKLESLLHSIFPKIFAPPPFMLVASDQIHAADYVAKHQSQRKKAKYFGIPLLVAAITGTVALQEIFTKIYYQINYKKVV